MLNLFIINNKLLLNSIFFLLSQTLLFEACHTHFYFFLFICRQQYSSQP